MPTNAQPASVTVSLDVLSKIRLLAAQRGFAKTIFSQGADGLSAYQITMEFRLLLNTVGIVLPTEALVTLDAAQLILAGGTAIEAIEKGASIAQAASPIGASVSAAIALLADLGIGGTAMTYIGDFSTESVNVMLVISSSGANVLADIGAVLGLIKCVGDFGVIFGGSHDAAVIQAKKSLSDAVNGIIQPQYQFAVSQMLLFQAGNLNPFDMIGNIALNSPTVFKNFFPGIATHFPSWVNTTISVTSTSSGIFSSSSDTENYTFEQLVTTKRQVQTVLVKEFLTDPMSGFIKDRYPSTQISLKALSALIMILTSADGSSPLIGFDFDILGAMIGLGLTPHFLGEDWLFQGQSNSDQGQAQFDNDAMLPYIPRTLKMPRRPGDSAIVVNGKPTLSKSDQDNLTYWNKLRKLQHAFIRADQTGDIVALMSNSESLAMLKSWATIDIMPTWPGDIDPYNLTRANYARMEPLNLILKPGSTPITSKTWFDPCIAATVDVSNRTYFDYFRQNYLIDLSDYWKALSTLNALKKANLFADPAGVSLLSGYSDSEAIQKCFSVAYNYYIAKSINLLARQNVSKYTGIASNKLQARLTSSGSLVFKQKGST